MDEDSVTDKYVTISPNPYLLVQIPSVTNYFILLSRNLYSKGNDREWGLKYIKGGV